MYVAAALLKRWVINGICHGIDPSTTVRSDAIKISAL